VGPELVRDEQKKVFDFLGRDTADQLLLCLEIGAVLVSEDLVLKRFASVSGVAGTLGVQAILLAALSKGLLSHVRYAEVIAEKARMRHEFVTINSSDLLVLARKESAVVSHSVLWALRSLESPSLEINTGVNMVREFLLGASPHLPSACVAEYSVTARESLVKGRDELRFQIDQALGIALQGIYGRNGRRLRPIERRAFNGLLEMPR
jgi:hypothetical protein